MSDQQQFIEHIVLFKVKPDVDSNKVNDMVNALNSLTSLNLTFHFTAGPLLKSTSSSSTLTFTHKMLHSRYKTVHDLHTYAVHSEHVRVVNANKPILSDVMAVDWICEGSRKSVSMKTGKVMRVSFVKLKDDKDKMKVLEVIRGVKELISVGENFSHDRAKGYLIAWVAVLDGVEELEKVYHENMELAKVKEFIESELVVEYVIPQ